MNTIFRVWDTKNKRWLHNNLLKINCHTGDITSLYYPDDILKQVVIEQQTSLIDINDIPVYIGDIVRMHQFLFDGNEIEEEMEGVIGQDDFGLILTQIRSPYFEEETGHDSGEGDCPLQFLYGLHERSWTVLGNIHENPSFVQKNSKRML